MRPAFITALSALFALVPVMADERPEQVVVRGKVVLLAPFLESVKIPADPGPIERQAVLLQEDGTIWPLLSTVESRAFFLDERLRDRPSELTAYRRKGLPYLQVLNFKVADPESSGSLRTPEYYCDVCTISVRYPQACPCCQGLMELRMKPDGDAAGPN